VTADPPNSVSFDERVFPMLKACTLFFKNPAMDPVEFQTYWRTEHVPHVKRMPNVRRYVQNHPRLDVGKPAPYDGFVELWVDDTAALKQLAASPEYARVVEDEKVFVDRPRIDLTLTEEHVVLDGPVPAGAVKQIVLLKRRPGMTPAEFQDHWLNVHAPLVGRPNGLCRYAQSHTKLSGYRSDREPTWDGFGEMWFVSEEAMRAARQAPGQERVRADGANFVDPDKLKSFLVTEHVMVA